MKRPAISDVLPLTPFQEGLLFHAMYDEEGPDVYAVQVVAELDGDLGATVLRSACQALVRRHPNLRACFRHTSAGSAVQVIPAAVNLPFDEHDLSALDDAARDTERARILGQDQTRRFDLTHSPLLRFTLLRLGARRHVLALANHHILLDGWSLSLLLQELFALYANGGSAAGLPAPAPYRDYLAWLGRQDQESARDAWRAALAGLAEPTLVADPGVARQPQVMPAAVTAGLSADDTALLAAWARQQGLTVSTIVQGCWALMLCALTGNRDVVFGVTSSGRPPQVPGIESMIGLFINTLPVRVRIDPGDRLAHLLTRLQEQNAALLPHQHIGLAEVQQLAGSSALFDTVIVFENYPLDARESSALPGGLRVVSAAGHDASHYPVNIRVAPGKALRLRFEYRPDLFGREWAERAAHSLLRSLSQVVTHATDRVGGLSGGLEGEVVAGPQGAVGPGVVERVLSVVSSGGADRVAVTDDARGAVSYGALTGWAGALAGVLRNAGAGPGCLVGVVAGPGAVFAGMVLGVLWAGGGFVPVDVAAPAGRSAGMLADAGVRVVVSEPEWAGLAGELACGAAATVVVWQPATGEAENQEAAEQNLARGDRVHGGPDDVAYVIFTSGSTGRPKGAMVTRKGLVNHLLAKVEDLGLSERDCVVQNAPLTFDVAVWQVLAALLAGGQVRVAGRDVATDPPGLFALAAASATVLEVVPSVLRGALEEWDAGGLVPGGPGLRWLVVTGEVLPPELCTRWFGYFPRIPVVNAYGPTECSDDVTHAVIRSQGELTGPRVPIGNPVRNTRLYVLGDALALAPAGVAGELYVGGTGVGLGYVRDPGRSAAVFVADPSGPPGSRMYRTGDRVVLRPDGQLEFVDRRDNQVKVRGHRIELGEVEATLHTVAGVADAAATVAAGPSGQPLLAGYLVLSEGQTATGVRDAVRRVLPDYMVPSVWLVLDALPLTVHGKTDRAALPPPSQERLATPGQEPRSPREQIICDVFADVLGLPQVGTTDSFFDLGGHSLLAAKAASRLRRLLGVQMPIRALFDAPTPAALAQTLRAGGRPQAREPLRPGDRPDPLPLSAGQQRLWFLSQLDGGSPAYNLPLALRLNHVADPAALAAALADVTARHEILRTIYPEADGIPRQVIGPADAARPRLHRSAVTASRLRTALIRHARHRFDLTREPPLRARLFTVTGTAGDSEQVLLLLLHHIAADGWSAAPLAQDLAAAYAARRAGGTPTWAPLPVQYADYTLWQRARLGDHRDPASLAGRQLAYWRQTLAGLPEELPLPADRPRPARASLAGGAASFTVSAAGHGDVAALGRRCGATVFMVIHAALAALFTRLGAGYDIPLGTVIAGRTDEALDDLVGFFVNTLILRTDTSGDPTVSELIQRARAASLAAYEHQDLPFETLVDDLQPARSLARQPLFQVMVAFQPPGDPGASLPDATLIPLETGSAKFDLSFEITEHLSPESTPNGITGRLEYAADLFDAGTATSIARRLTSIVGAMAADPALRLSQLPVLDAAERHRILHDWASLPAPAAASAPPTTLTSSFAVCARRFADRAAITYAGAHTTYRQLDTDANRLASYLVARHHIRPGDIVAVALPRTPGFITAILAILKSGAAYLPVDPAYPPQRITAMLADARPAAAVTTVSLAELTSAVPSVLLDAPETASAIAGGPDAAPATARPVTPADAAYVIYTSGSTGTPKGVVVTHGNAARLFGSTRHLFDFGPDDVWTLFHSFAFDFSVWEQWGALLHGGRLVLVPYSTSRSPEEFLALLAAERVTVLSQTPSAFYQLMQADRKAAACRPDAGTALRFVIFGGEALDLGRLADWYARHADTAPALVNMFGITETTVHVTYLALGETDATANNGSLVGTALADLCVYLLDDTLRPVPAGVAGEIYVAGAGLSRGYLGRPALTAQRFVASPFGEPGARMYRSGDLGRWHADGRLEHLGRSDQQVQLRGFRIETGEIETVLARHEAVAQVAVILREDRPGDQRLAAYVVPSGTAAADLAELRRFAAGSLPEYMLPASMIIIPEMPLTTNGKLDRPALPAPGVSDPESSRGPRTPQETVLCSLFAEVLGVPQVGIDQNFFLLGGNSLLAAQFISRARQALGAHFTIRDLFEAPVIADLAVHMDGNGKDQSFDTLVPLRKGGDRPPVFCMHPSGGIAWMYIGLAPHINSAHPIYGLQARGITRPAALPDSIEAMAAGYLQRMRTVQPAGPYFLAGWSFGGALAHEVAVQMQDLGEEIAMLAILDAYPPAGTEDAELDEQRILREFLGRLGHERIPERSLEPSELVTALQQFSNPLSGFDEAQIRNLLNVWRHNVRLFQRFAPGHYKGDALLIRATKGRDSAAPDAESWRSHIDGAIETYDIDCEHDDMMEQAALHVIGPVIAAEVERAGSGRLAPAGRPARGARGVN